MISNPYIKLWKNIEKKRKFYLSILLLLILITSFTEMLSITAIIPFLGVLTYPEKLFEYELLNPFINYMGIKESKELLLPITVLFVSAIFISGLLRLILIIFQTRISHGIGSDLSINIYKKTLYQPYYIHISRNSSEVMASITTKANAVVGSVIVPIINIVSSSFIFVTVLVLLYLIQPIITIYSLVFLSFSYLILFILFKNLLNKYSQEVSLKYNQVYRSIQEGLGGIREVLLNHSQKLYSKIYTNADISLRKALANISILGSSPRYIIETIGIITISIFAYLMINSNQDFISNIPILGAFAMAAQKILPIVQNAFDSWTKMKGNRHNLLDVLQLLEQEVLDDKVFQDIKALPFYNDISLKNIIFSYNQKDNVLMNLNLKIKKGSIIGIIGETGCGKSTLLDVLTGLLNPINGEIFVDDVKLNSSNIQKWQKNISYVHQSIFLADLSIKENIAFGIHSDDINFDLVKEASVKAQINKTIDSFDDKYNTVVGERGVKLSGGQCQRIALARALYKKSKFIILDEATSALDYKTEESVMQFINLLSDDITVLIVTHRESTLKNCDVIYELSEGKLKNAN